MAYVKKADREKVVEENVPTAPEVKVVVSNVVSRPTDGTVNDLVADKLPSLNDPGQS